ncbi:ATP-dependent DNA ligase [Sporomusaceae bacterium FL31]|nr:ATP-dependent DNA ligase [Sporomusaceae bacterium FL31]GCE35893.1 ATP-dependent DNA ligase [Sporomusaceae bacterium]
MQIIKPMLAKSAALPEDDHNFSYEIKWDGIRAIAYIEPNQLRMLSRNSLDLTAQYPELQQLAIKCNNHSLILDGEIVAFNTKGRPSFELLQQRMNLTSAKSINKMIQHIPVTYIIFDVLAFNGGLLLDQKYTNRRSKLESLMLSGPHWQVPDYTVGTGKEILEATRALGLEGIMAKRLDSAYHPGQRSDDWLKIKNIARQELIICGWVPGKGNRQGTIGALLLGYYDHTPEKAKQLQQPQHLIYAGKVGSGFTKAILEKLQQLLQPLIRHSSPFNEDTPRNSQFVEPHLVGEFAFTEWTSNHTLRHPVFKGFRTDKDPHYIVRELN